MGAEPAVEQDNVAPVETILVVDDEVLVRLVIADYLRDCGYRVVEAGNGAEAIAILETNEPISLVFSDVQMPEIDGFQLAQWVRRERPGLNVVLTSGGVKSAEAARDVCEAGPILPKPYQFHDVIARIRAHLSA